MKEPMVTYEGWTIDPSLQTPAYMANFRPAYVKKLKEKARKKRTRG